MLTANWTSPLMTAPGAATAGRVASVGRAGWSAATARQNSNGWRQVNAQNCWPLSSFVFNFASDTSTATVAWACGEVDPLLSSDSPREVTEPTSVPPDSAKAIASGKMRTSVANAEIESG